MSFVNPLGLLGLTSLPVIVGLHIHLERNRRAVVSSLFLWAFLDAKLEGQRPRQIKLNWLLVLDLLVAAVLTLALAQPQIEIKSAFTQDTHTVVLLDTSTSMLATDFAPSRLELAKAEVYGLIDTVGQNGVFTVVSVSNAAEIVGDSREVSETALKGLVEGVVAGGTGVDLHSGLALAQAVMSERKEIVVHIITDGAFELEEDPADFPFTIQWHFVGAEAENLAVASPRFVEVEDGQFQVLVQLINHSDKDKINNVKVFADGKESSQSEILMPAGSVTPYIVNLSGLVDYVQVEINSNDVLGEDDFAGAGRAGESIVHIALVADQPDPLDRAILSVPNVEMNIISPEDYNYAADYDLTIFRDYLPSEWPDGVIFVVDLPIENEILTANGVRSIDPPLELTADPLTDGLTFSGVRWQDARGMLDSQSDFDALIVAGETPLLLERDLERGNLIVFLPFLEVGNLTMHPVFPLLISNVVESAREILPEQQYNVGEDLIFSIDLQEYGVSLKDPALNEIRIDSSGDVRLRQFGQYAYMVEESNSKSEEVSFGVNAGDWNESNISPREWAVDLAEEEFEVVDNEIILDLTPWLLGLVVVLLLVEAWRAWR